MSELDSVLKTGNFDIRALAEKLDALAPRERLLEVRALTRPAQAALYESAKGARKLTLEDLVPSSVPDLSEVVHEGKNTLVMFTHFAKVFCRPPRAKNELWGYNRAGAVVENAVGPGYYVAYEGPGDEVLIDYTRVPEGKPESWPRIVANKSGLSRLVYADMVDALRAVSTHVSVGRAMKKGKVLDNWFVLCRASP
jgi:hypothetical protein